MAEAHSRKRHLDVGDPMAATPGSTLPTTPRTTQGVTPAGSTLGRPAAADVNVLLTVDDVATGHGTLPACSAELALADVAQLLLSTGHTAAIVLDGRGVPEGLITEGDILQSYLHGAPWDITVGEWIRGGGGARLRAAEEPPAKMPRTRAGAHLPAPSVPAGQPLHEALPALFAQAQPDQPGRGFVRHDHLLVQGSPGGYRGGVLSPMDLVRGIAERRGDPKLEEMFGIAQGATVGDLMEPASELPSFAPGQTMQQLLVELLSSPVRAALVSDEQGTHGLVTPSDALWAFKQQVCRTADAWQKLSSKPDRMMLEQYSIPANAPLSKAAAAMLSMPVSGEGVAGGSKRNLVAVTPGGEVVGILSPSLLARASAPEIGKPARAPDLTAAVQEEEPQMAPPPRPQQSAGSAEPAPEADFAADVKEEVAEVEPQSTRPETTQPPVPKTRRRHRFQRRAVKPHATTIGDIVAMRKTATCSPADKLVDAAFTLVESGRTAAVVVNIRGDVRGVLTENDLLAALVTDASWNCTIDSWLRGDKARLPGFMVPALTLGSKATVAQAAAEMADMADADIGNTCHHLLVSGGAGDIGGVRLLSALDIARGLLDAAAAENAGAASGVGGVATVEAAEMTVGQAMKKRSSTVPSCKLSDSLAEAFCLMYEAGQNCVIVVRGALSDCREPDWTGEMEEDPVLKEEQHQREHGTIYGVITAADALRAFSQKQRGTHTTIASWLRGQEDRKSARRRTISAGASLSDAALAMAEAGVHHLLVLDKEGAEVAGVLSALDIVCALADCFMFQFSKFTAAE